MGMYRSPQQTQKVLIDGLRPYSSDYDWWNLADFHGMDHGLLVKVVQILEKQGRAVMFDAGSVDTAGVKFLPPQ